jgi:glycosyltransferase involved in cell wall biosynthesis
MSQPELQRVRVLHLITKLPIGGAQDNTLTSVAGADRSIFEVDIASSPGGAWEERARDAADKLCLIPTLRREMAPAADAQAVHDIVRLLRRRRYHIVHTHSSKAGTLGRIATRLAQTPVVVHTVHGFAFNDLTFSRLTRQMYLWLERFGARLSDQMVMVSELNRQEALAKRIVSAEKMTVIYSGINLAHFANLPHKRDARQQLDIPPHHRVVGTVGRMATCNAPLVFIEAAHQLLTHFPDLTILMVGDDPKWRPRVEAAIGNESRIRLLGYRTDVPEILAAMDVFMSSNLWGGLGRALTEALAAGVPAVAFPVNGVPELVEDGVTGLHAQTGLSADLAAKTAHLLQHPALAQQLATAGRERVWRKFGADKMVADLDQLYRRLLIERDVALPPVLTPVSL